MQRLIAFALTQRLLVALLAVGLAFAGYEAFRQLPIDAFPDISPTQVKIIMKAPGMTPEEVETRITAPIEVELLGIPNQTMLRSMTKYALADITLDFAEGTDIYWARQQVAERLTGVRDSLPDGIEGGIAPMTTPLGEMFMFTVDGPQSLAERRTLLEWVIRPALRTVPGVADVNVLGGYVRSFEVVPDPMRMAARGVDTLQLEAAVAANNRNDGAGRINEGEEALLVRSEGRIKEPVDVERIVVRVENGIPISVADVATVKIGSITRYGAVTQSGQAEAVEGLVLGLRGANARDVVAGARAKLEEIKGALPAGVDVRIFYDRGHLVDEAVNTVAHALGEAVVLVLVLLLLFLGDLRAAVTVAVVLPLAALATFLAMRLTGMSANLMSLGGLAIAIGMLVDAAVVVVENISTQLGSGEATRKLPRLHVVYRAAREVAVPMASGIAIIILVFLPLLSLQGLEGKLFAPVALTISFALGGSLLLSLTVIPVLASFLMRRVEHHEPWLPRKLGELYRPLLERALANSRVVIGVALGALVLTAVAYPFIGKTFMPTMDEGDLIVQLEKLPSITLAESVDLDLRVQEAILARVPEVTRIVARVGSDEIGMDPMGLNESDTFMVLKPRSEWRMKSKEELVAAIRAVLEDFPGVAYGFTQPIEMRTAEMLTGTRGDVAVKLFGADLAELSAKADEIAATLRSIPGSEDVFVARNSGMQYLNVAVDRTAAGRLNVRTADLQRILRAQVEGLPIGIVQEGVRRTPLVIRADEDVRGSARNFAALPLALGDSRSVPVSSVARVERVEGVVSIARERGQRFIVVRTNVVGRDLVGFVDEARQKVAAAVQLPPGYLVQWGGQFENQQRAAARLALVVPIAVGLVFLLLFSTFGSLRQALLVLTNVPFALVGGVFALLVTGEYLSVPASVGFIALLGIAVLNGVVMVTYFNQLRSEGMPLGEVVVRGAQRRLRPVMMTASIAAIGLVPLLFASGPGSEIQRPLAIVVIGGLISATALTLILLPILYQRFGTEGERHG
ncbi:MAG TPA: CusA/CzcA family heavy metal efflux RND transporter [Gammaproteobacteria bacterium]|jgi:cobalt-zinc-cadmium resistance protein CzcA|nr:CusA/CzcA family heavy metal efflux RND transporter [Gammaproteobacteria bacterium]